MSTHEDATREAARIAAMGWKLGAMLVCEWCDHVEEASTDECTQYILSGWPKHCGFTMNAKSIPYR